MYPLLEFAATWWLQSTALVVIGLTMALGLRKPAHQSYVFRVTLVAVLICPLATQLMSQMGLTMFTMDLQSQFLGLATPKESLNTFYLTANEFSEDITRASRLSHTLDAKPSVDESLGDLIPSTVPSQPVSAQPIGPAAAAENATNPASAISGLLHRADWLTLSANALLFIWVIGTIIFLARLLFELWRGQTLLRQSVPADSDCDKACRQVAARLKIRSQPRVVVNPFLASPCLLGHWRPVILMPEEIDSASYDQVFLHELAHLRRSDWLWTIIGRISQSILWYE